MAFKGRYSVTLRNKKDKIEQGKVRLKRNERRINNLEEKIKQKAVVLKTSILLSTSGLCSPPLTTGQIIRYVRLYQLTVAAINPLTIIEQLKNEVDENHPLITEMVSIHREGIRLTARLARDTEKLANHERKVNKLSRKIRRNKYLFSKEKNIAKSRSLALVKREKSRPLDSLQASSQSPGFSQEVIIPKESMIKRVDTSPILTGHYSRSNNMNIVSKGKVLDSNPSPSTSFFSEENIAEERMIENVDKLSPSFNGNKKSPSLSRTPSPSHDYSSTQSTNNFSDIMEKKEHDDWDLVQEFSVLALSDNDSDTLDNKIDQRSQPLSNNHIHQRLHTASFKKSNHSHMSNSLAQTEDSEWVSDFSSVDIRSTHTNPPLSSPRDGLQVNGQGNDKQWFSDFSTFGFHQPRVTTPLSGSNSQVDNEENTSLSN